MLKPVVFDIMTGVVALGSGGVLVQQGAAQMTQHIVEGAVLAMLTLAGAGALIGFRLIWGRLDKIEGTIDERLRAVEIDLTQMRALCHYCDPEEA